MKGLQQNSFFCTFLCTSEPITLLTIQNSTAWQSWSCLARIGYIMSLQMINCRQSELKPFHIWGFRNCSADFLCSSCSERFAELTEEVQTGEGVQFWWLRQGTETQIGWFCGLLWIFVTSLISSCWSFSPVNWSSNSSLFQCMACLDCLVSAACIVLVCALRAFDTSVLISPLFS